MNLKLVNYLILEYYILAYFIDYTLYAVRSTLIGF